VLDRAYLVGLTKRWRKFRLPPFFYSSRSEWGATAIEYGLLIALISIAIIVGAMMAGNGLNSMFAATGTVVSSTGSNAQSAAN